jgi:hypothetical protein
MRLLLLSLIFILQSLPAFAGMHGHTRVVSPRGMFNIGTPAQFDYAFINFLQEGDSFLSPFGSNWAASGTCFWNSAGLDANGWPNQACANGLAFGGGIRYPSSAQFSGQYTVDGSGLGVFSVGIGTQFTLSSGVTCGGVASGTAPNNTGSGWGYSSAVNGTITTNDTAGTGFCVPFTNVGQSTPLLENFIVSNTCSTTSGGCVGAFIKNVRLYQQRDFVRLNAGNIFRSEYLQTIANFDPSYVRFMDWGPGDAYSTQVRYENRPKPTTSGLVTGSYWLSSPPYTVSTGTNLLSVAAAAGTPGSMVHGEVATFKFANTMNNGSNVFAQNGVTISAVSLASPGAVTTSAVHGYATGDVIIHNFSSPTNMPKLNLYPVCITVVDTTHYTMQVFTVATNTCTATPVDTTSFGAFSATGTNYSVEYTSLNVGARVNAPIADADGRTPLMNYFKAGAGSYALNMTYDKNSCAITNGAGVTICGAWLVNHIVGLASSAGGQGANPQLAPIEIEVKFINEVNALLTGGQHPVGLWINMPHMGMVSTDPDYTTASDYPRNMANTIINGTYPLCAGCPVLFENSNEWWNNFYPTFSYYSRQNFLRYGVVGPSDFGTVRTIQMFEDIRNNSGVYNPSVFKFAMVGGPPGAAGDPRLSGHNHILIFGDATIFADARWPNAASPPWAYFDYGGWAPYTNPSTAFYSTNTAITASQWCAAQATACAATPPQAPNCVGAVDTTWCLPWVVNGVVGGAPTADQLTISDILTNDSEFLQALSSVGKSVVSYEGSANWATCVGCSNFGGTVANLTQSNYLIAVYQSQSWSNAWINYCSTRLNDTYSGGCGNLSEITLPTGNWQFAFSSPDTFGSTTTEGSGLNFLWGALGTFNSSLAQ